MPFERRVREGMLWKACAENAEDAQLRGDLEGAEKQFVLSLAFAKQARGSFHADVGEALMNLADFFLGLERFSEAEGCYRQALAVYDGLFGKENLITAMIYRILSEMYLIQSRMPEAQLLQARSAAILCGREAS